MYHHYDMYSFLIFLKCRRYFTWSPSLFTNISKNHRKNFNFNNLGGFLVLFIFLQHILLSSNLYECSFIPHHLIPNKLDINSTRNNSNNTATINFSTMMTNTTTTTLTITSSTTMANRYYILPTKAVPTITNSSINLPNPLLSLYQNQSSHNSSHSTNNQSIRINISTLVMIPLPATIISTKFSTGKAIYEIKSTSTIISTADAASTLTRVSPNINNNLCVNDSSNSNFSPNKSVLCTKKPSLSGDEPSSLAFRPISLDIPPSFIAPAIPLKYVQIHVGYPTALRKGGIDYYKDQERQHERQEKPPTINIGLLLPANCRYLSCLSKVAPAMRIAFRRHKVESLLSGFTINIIQGDTNCSQIEGPLVAIRMIWFEKVVALFGPVCDFAIDSVSIMTSRFFNIPFITAGAFNPEFGRNKKAPDSAYPMLTRVGVPLNSIFPCLVKLFRYYNWSQFFFLYEVNSHPEVINDFGFQVASGITRTLNNYRNYVLSANVPPPNPTKKSKKSEYEPKHTPQASFNKSINSSAYFNSNTTFHYPSPNKSRESTNPFPFFPTHKAADLDQMLRQNLNYANILQEIGTKYSIIILCASQSTVRKILLTAYDLNMIQSGEYVFFNIELFNKPDRKIPMWQVDADTAENNAKAKIAYEALFTLTMRMPDNDEYRKFSDQVKEISKRVYGFDYGTENVNAFVSAFHDAVILYALALNETLQAGFNYTDGVEITRRMWNRTFTGITGNVSIDANGDRYTDYSLWDLNPETGRFQVVLNYYGKENSLVEIGGKSIHWAGGRTEPPLDRPRCGYDGSLCKKKEIPNYAIIITFLGCLVIFLSILSFFIYRRYRLEAELGAMKWRIDWNDLMFQSVLQPKDNIKFHSKWSLTRLSLDNDRELDNFSTDTGVSENLMEESETEGANLDFPNHNSSTYQQEKGKSFSKYCGVTAPYTVCKSRAGYLRLKKRSSQAKKKRLLSKIEPDYFSDRSGSLKNTRLSRSSFATGDHYNESRLSKVSHSLHHHHHHHKKSSDSYHWYGGDFGGKYKKDSYIGTVRIAYYKSVPVILKPVVNKKKIEISRPLLLEIKQRKDLQNDYVTRFVGACLDNVNPRHNCLAMEYCQKGSLRDILENTRLQLDWMFRYSLMHDLTKGMSFLHNSEIRSHGNLKSTNCLVDSRFVLKITDFGLHLLRPNYDAYYRGTPEYYERKLWTAPEILRLSDPPPGGTQKADVYSFAIIMQEIVLRKGTFYIGDVKYSSKDIVQRVKAGYNLVSPNHYFRPTLVGADCEDEVIKLIEKCWSEDPNDRIDFNAVRLIIRKINKENESDNILDNLLSRMEHYANNLENLVEERTADYLEQKRKAEEILYQLLPKSVATQLIHGESVTAESFDSVTIYFSDIVGFTSISACSTPMQVVDLLNDLYTCFDSTIGNFDVYKVETIGDAYMVVSGLPKRINSNEHAKEISSMAIALQKSAGTFTIRHRPFEKLVLRIGIHSGPCVAGVVGLKMPRYCLFGDTVNTASRMESTGKPNMIHISSVTRNLIQPLGIFDLELRGEVDVKGKGTLTTYWLLGYKEKPKDDENGADDDNHIKPDPKTSEEHSKTNKKEESLEITETHKDELAGDISDFQYKSEIEIPQHKRDPIPISLSEPTSSTTDTPQEQNILLDTPGSANSEGIQSTESSNYSVTSAFLNSSDLEHSPIERLRKVSAKLLMNDNDKPLNAFNNNNDDSSNNNRKSMYATPPSSPIMMKCFGTEATNTSPSSPPTTARSSEDESQDSVKPLRSDIRRNARNNAQKKNPLSPQHHCSRSPTSLNKNSERNHATLAVDPLSIIPPEYQAIKFLPLKGSQHHDIVLAATQEAVTEPRGARAITSLFKTKAKHFLSSTLSNLSLPNSFSTTSLSPPGYNCKNRDVDAAAAVFTFNTAPLLTKNKTQTDQGLNHNNKKCNTIHLRKNNTCDSFLFSQTSKARQSDNNNFNFTSDSSSPNNIGILNQNNATTAKNKAFVGKNPERNSISADMMMLNEHPHIVMKDISNNQKA